MGRECFGIEPGRVEAMSALLASSVAMAEMRRLWIGKVVVVVALMMLDCERVESVNMSTKGSLLPKQSRRQSLTK